MARRRFGLAPFRSPLLRPLLTSSGYVRCFSSPAYLHRHYVFMAGSQGSPPCGVPPFGDPRLPARARLPEAFRCYATSFFGTNGLGIHPTPLVTVAFPHHHGVAPVALGPCHCHTNPQTTHNAQHYYLQTHPAPCRARPCFALVLAPRLVRCSRSRPRLLPNEDQAANGDHQPEKKMVEMRRLELLTPSVQRRCSPN